MVKCSNCGKIVQEGKFCESCGKPLVPAEVVLNVKKQTSTNEKKQSNGGFFDKVVSAINKAVTNLLAIKSDYSNKTLICVVNKVSKINEKKVKVNSDEIVYLNKGDGYAKYDKTFTLKEDKFICCFLKREIAIQNNFNLEFDCHIKNIPDKAIKVANSYQIEYRVNDIDMFFNELIKLKQSSWSELDLNARLADEINKILIDNTLKMLNDENNLDLRNPKTQIEKFSGNILEIINECIKKYGIEAIKLTLTNLTINIEDLNKVLIENLYKGE